MLFWSAAPMLPLHVPVCNYVIAFLSAAEQEERRKLWDKQLVRRVGSARVLAKSRSISVDADRVRRTQQTESLPSSAASEPVFSAPPAHPAVVPVQLSVIPLTSPCQSETPAPGPSPMIVFHVTCPSGHWEPQPDS